MALEVTFGLDLRGSRRFDEEEIDAFFDELAPEIRAEASQLYGFLRLRDGAGQQIELDDQIEALAINLCFKAVRALVDAPRCEVERFAFNGEIQLESEGEGLKITLEGRSFVAPREALLTALYDAGARIGALASRLELEGARWLHDEAGPTRAALTRLTRGA